MSAVEVVRGGVVESGHRVQVAVCDAVCFAVPLDAMTDHPFMVGGSGRTCTDVMDVAGDRVFVKLGAEGVYGGGLRDRGLGFAIKLADGGRRAVEVVGEIRPAFSLERVGL